MLSKLCRPHPLRLCRHVLGARHLNSFEDLGLNFLGCTQSVEDGELLYIPVHRAAVQAAGKLPEGSPQPAPPAVPSCALSCLPLCNAIGCICLGGTPCALKTAFFVWVSLRVPCDPLGICAMCTYNLGWTEVSSWAKFLVSPTNIWAATRSVLQVLYRQL